jgi:hypothetical protein
MTNERQDDEIIGRALSRAIETIDVNETPFEHARIAAAPARRSIFGLWQIATAAAAIVLALAIGSWLTRPSVPLAGPSAVPSAASPAATPASVVGPTTTPAPAYPLSERVWVYFARDGLAPAGVFVQGPLLDTSVETRIASRITALGSAHAGGMPYLATNALSLDVSRGISVRVQGDTATVEFNVPNGWGVKGAAQTNALLQQLVYTITAEPGIRRALITETGKPNAVIDQLVVNKALSREDVFGYGFRAAVGKDQGISWGGDDSLAHIGGALQSVDAGTARVIIGGRSVDTGAKSNLPSFAIWLEQSDDTKPASGKYALNVQFQWNGGGSSGGATSTPTYAESPLRSITMNGLPGTPTSVYRFELDDARPWRAYMPDKTQLVIEIGGDPRSTSDRIAVTTPKSGDRLSGGAQFAQSVRVTGAARVFEATVSWRVRDSAGTIVASSHFNASLGSSALWGVFDNSFAVPASVHGNVTLELYEASPKDGSEQGLVAIPLVVP